MADTSSSSRDPVRPDTEPIHRGLRRANTMALIVVVVLLGLAAGVLHQMRSAENHLRDAQAARLEAEQGREQAAEARLAARRKLFESKLQEARFHRLSGRADARRSGLEAASEAASIRVTPELRTEAVGLLQLDALQLDGMPRVIPGDAGLPIFDTELERYVMGDGRDGIGVYRFADNQRLQRFTGLPRPAQWIRFSPNGRTLGARLASGELMAWDLSESRLLWSQPGLFYIGVDGALDFSPDGNSLAVAARQGAVSVLRVTNGGELQGVACEGRVHGIRFDPSGTRLAIAEGNTLSVWELPGNRLLKRFELGQATLNKLHWHPNGQLIAGAGSDALVYLCPLASGAAVQRLAGHVKPVVHVAFNRRGDWLISDAFDGTMRLWDVERRETLLTTTAAFGNYFTPDDQALGFVRARIAIGKWRIVRGLVPRWSSVSDAPAITRPETGSSTLEAADQQRGIAVTATTTTALQVRGIADGRELAQLEPPPGVTLTGLRFDESGELHANTSTGRRLVWPLAAMGAELEQLGLGWRAGLVDDAAMHAGAPATGIATTANTLASRPVFLVATIAALLLACAAAVAAWWRHRGLLRQLVSSESLVAEQHQRLNHAHQSVMHTQKMQALGTLAAGVAHDFNNLLSVIRMSGKIIGRESGGQPAVAENVAAIEKAVLQGRSVVSALLGYSREHADPSAAFSVAAAVEDTVAMLSRKYLETVTLTLELDKTVPPVIGAKRRLEQVLLNLIVNAVEAMDSRGELLIRVRQLAQSPAAGVLAPRATGGCVELLIQDSGPGIPDAIRVRIFEPFFTTKHAGAAPGTGLGLSTVYMLAQQDGWGIALDPGPGAGAAFRIFLPVESVDSAT